MASQGTGQRLESLECHEDTALVRADARASKPAVDDMRLAEDQELRAEWRLAAGAEDHVTPLHVAVHLLGEPWLHREIRPWIEADQVDRVVMVADARMLDANDLLGRRSLH